MKNLKLTTLLLSIILSLNVFAFDEIASIGSNDQILLKHEVNQLADKSKLKLEYDRDDLNISLSIDVRQGVAQKLEDIEGSFTFRKVLSKKISVMGGISRSKRQMKAFLTLMNDLPLGVQMSTTFNSDGSVRITLKKVIPLSERLSLEISPGVFYQEKFSFNVEAKLIYKINKRFSLFVSANHQFDSGETFFGIGGSISF